MGHENESLDEFVEAHKTCLNDLMYFPTRNAYGLSSVAGTVEKLAALQNEFENVKRKMDDDNKKAQRLEKKIDVLTHGYKVGISHLLMNPIIYGGLESSEDGWCREHAYSVFRVSVLFLFL